MLEQLIAKSLILILYFQIVLSLRIYKLTSEDDIGPRLNEILDTEKSEKAEYRKNSIFFREKPNYRRNNPLISQPFLGKSILVSRIIPHGYQAGSYEYDSKLNTVYKPLIRFHIKKPIEQQEHDILDSMNEKNKVIGYVLTIKKNSKKPKNLLSEIKKLLTKNKKKMYGYEVGSLNNILRQDSLALSEDAINKLVDKSLEDFTGGRPGFLHPPKTAPTGPKVVIPEYPFWNYWTYAKTLHQDDCPGSLIKLGTMCITPSGHRRLMQLLN